MSKRQSGLTLIEVIASLAIMSGILLGASRLIDTYAQSTRQSVLAEQLATFGKAANAYIRDNYSAVESVASPTTPAMIRVSTLTSTGYLTSGFAAQNSYGQTLCALVLQPMAGQLNALVVTEAGSAINDLDLGQIAGLVGGAGGGVYSGSPATLTGTMGGWSMPVGAFANANSSGEHCDGSAGTVSIAAGHALEALWFAGGDRTAGVLYRNAVPGQPSRNTMNTPIVMSASTIETAGAACPSTGAIARDASGRVLACQNGSWQYNGSLYWADPVAAYSNLPSTDPVGTVRMVTALGRAFMWTGGAWAALGIDQNGDLTVPNWVSAAANTVTLNALAGQGGYIRLGAANGANVYLENNNGVLRILNNPWSRGVTVDQNGNFAADGRLTAGEFVQIDGTASAGAGCSPNGLVGRDASGSLLLCQSGVWKAPSAAPSGWSCANYVAYSYFTTYPACSVYVPPTSHSLMFVASATVGDMWGGGHGAGVEVGNQSNGIFTSAIQSAANGYTVSDSETYIVPSSYSGQWWTVYGYNSSGRGDYVFGYLSIVEVN